MKKTLLSFVIPCYRSEKTIEKVINEIDEVMQGRDVFDYEIIAVNDCSPDKVYEVLQRLAAGDKRLKVINLARNMGKHSAVMAGYSFVNGDYIINLDDDFQTPVNELWSLMEPVLADECDIATAEYARKKEALWKRVGSDFNLWISSILLEKPRNLRFTNFSVIKRFVCDEVITYKNPYPFLEGLFLRITRRIAKVPMEERERTDGNKTGFTFAKSVSLFINGLTSFSIKPLRVAAMVGVMFSFAGFLYGTYIIIRKITYPDTPMGYSSIMAILLFSSGLIMLMLGMIGEYVGRIFISINNAPQYVVRSTINVEERKGKGEQ